MVDQVARLNTSGSRGVPAQPGFGGDPKRVVESGRRGELRFLYLAPERLGAPGFLDN